MRKKLTVEKIEVADEAPKIEIVAELELVSEDFGREDLNKLARKVNELIRKCL